MTKREKIIVGVMCLTIVYGAYELLGTRGIKKSTPSAAPQTNPADETRKFATEMTQKLVAERVGSEAQHAVNQASSPWTKDPFLQSAALIESKPSEQPTGPKQVAAAKEPAPAFTFTGFLQIGDTRLAIINGLEYAVGDMIGTSGNYLESISPDGVVISSPNGEKIQLTLSEID